MSANGNTSAAVKNQRAPRLVEADDATRALWRTLDWFGTPPWATRTIAELIHHIDPHAHTAWDPAAGDDIMARVLAESFATVHRSDVHVQRQTIAAFDFTRPVPAPFAADWIVTNPPFALAKTFTERALERARCGVAMLCRLNWLESADRHALFHGARHPLAFCFPFAERVAMQLGPWDPDCSSATAYAWFVWAKDARVPPIRTTLLDGPCWLGQIIPPGTRARLTRKDDVQTFCAPKDAPLFSAGNGAAEETGSTP